MPVWQAFVYICSMEKTPDTQHFVLNGKGIFYLSFGFVSISIIIGILHGSIQNLFGINLLNHKWAFLLLNALTIGFPIVIFHYFYLKPHKQNLGFHLKFCSLKDFFTILPMMFGMILIAEAFSNLIPTEGQIWGDLFHDFQKQMNFISQDHLVMYLMVVVLAPVLEEILFRGIILKGLINKGVLPNNAIWISSLVFAIVHGNPWQFVGALLLGMVLGLVYFKTESILTVIVLHALNNLLSILVILYTDAENFYEIVGIGPSLSLALGIVIFSTFYTSFTKEPQETSQ